MVNLRIVSLGALAAHPLRDEKTPVRLGHGTTTLVEIPHEGKRILVDPALPGTSNALIRGIKGQPLLPWHHLYNFRKKNNSHN